MCGGKGGSAPDNSGMNAAALAQAELSKEQLAWAKDIYAQQAPDRAASAQRANKVSDAQLASMTQNDAIAKDYNDYAKGTFRPLEQKMVADAQAYDTPERQQAKANEAIAGVESQFAKTQESQQRNMSRMGVNPNSGKWGASFGMDAAKAKAGAAQAARNQVETQGYARKSDAANLGRGLASSQATSAGVALNAGNAASANGQAVNNINAQGNSIMTQGFSGASNSMASSGSLYGQSAQIQNTANANNNAQMAAIGQTAGAMFAMSDVRLKTDIRGLKPKAALDAINNTPVSKWTYKEGSKADDGGKEHIGPMAQDVQATMGDKAAPNGTAIDLISMNGVTMAAIQELSNKVDKLAGSKGLRRKA
jgi:hypothetical protein